MRNLSAKTDDVGDTLPASDFNANLRLELQNFVTSASFSLDPEGGPDTDVEMLGKSAALYANAAGYYTDTGAANAYVVNRVGTIKALSSYVEGVVITFKAANTSTGASTINVDSLGVKTIVNADGSAITNSDIVANRYTSLRYNATSGNFEVVYSGGKFSLSTWRNIGNDLLPVVSGTGSIGNSNSFVDGIYLGTSSSAFFGDDQWFYINHDSSAALIENTLGVLTIGNVNASNLIFKTNDQDRWIISASGTLRPNLSNTYDIGTSTVLVADIYQGDGQYHYFGNDQDMWAFHTGTFGFVENSTGNLYVGTTVGSNLILKTSDTERWYVHSNGNLVPFTANAYDIGTAAQEVKDIYQADNAYHYFGSDQDAYLRYETTGDNFRLSTGGTTSIILDGSDTLTINTGGLSHWLVNNAGDMIPIQTSQDLGSNTNPVDVIYYNTLTLVSDRRLKSNIGDSFGLDFILDLNPCSFNFDRVKSDRRRYGLIAQDVADVLEQNGFTIDDFAGLQYDYNEDIFGIDYIQFIGPIIKAIQELYDKIN